jgi:hypothetical protein
MVRASAAVACAACACLGAVVASTSGARSRRGLPASARIAAVGLKVATTASNKQAARRDATQLLDDVVPPAGATPQSSGTGIGPGAHLLTAALASAVAYRRWVVPGDPASVLSSVEGKLPAGITVVSTGGVVSTGAGGPSPSSQSVTYSWPAVAGVLDGRWLQVAVSPRVDGRTSLSAEAQSQWVITRPRTEKIPASVREVEVTSGSAGQPPFLTRRVSSRLKVHALVALTDSLGIVQPVGINCPEYIPAPPIVTLVFRAAANRQPLASLSVSAVANFSWPADVAGWSCFPIGLTVRGRPQHALAGNVITPIERLLHVNLARP